MTKKIFHIGIISIFIFNLAIVGLALAQNDKSTGTTIIQGFEKTGIKAGFETTDKGAPKRQFNDAFSDYATGLASITGILFMILTLYAGWLWMSARGNDDQVKKAKDILLGAIIGIAVIIGALIIVQLTLFALKNTLEIT